MTGSFSNVGSTSNEGGITIRETERIVGAVADYSYIEDKLDLLVATLKDMNLNVQVNPPDTVVNIPENPISVTPKIDVILPTQPPPEVKNIVQIPVRHLSVICLLIVVDILIKLWVAFGRPA